jgi:hypothetical protein
MNTDGMSYTFILKDIDPLESDPDIAVRREIKHVVSNEQTWDELLCHFEEWLTSCGYILPEGHLKFVEGEQTITCITGHHE